MRTTRKPKSTFQQKAFSRMCTDAGLPKPIAEYRFHNKRKWRVDYYFETDDIRVALEV